MTPYEKLKSLQNAAQFLKPSLNFRILDDIAYAITDNQAAELLQKQRQVLFKHIHDDCKKRA